MKLSDSIKNWKEKDQKVRLEGFYACKDYPETLRRIEYEDPEKKKKWVFLINNLKLAASTIASIYKACWKIELFFKWIKQSLKIKSFSVISKNAVMTQVWIAMCYYLLMTYIKYQTKFAHSLLVLIRILRETLMDRKALIDILTLKPEKLVQVKTEPIQ